MPAVSGPLQHQVRVAGNLCRILEREVQLGPANDQRERDQYARLLGHEGDLPTLNAELAERLLTGDAELAQRAFPVLVDTTMAKLSVNKPGYDRIGGGR